MGPVDTFARSHPGFRPDAAGRTAFLVFDTESVPDGRLIADVKYPGEDLTPQQAIERAQVEALSSSGSDFLPVSFQIPTAVAVVRVAADFTLESVACLDAPHFRPREIAESFWLGTSLFNRAKLVTFHGRQFDLPLMELAAYRYGLPMGDHVQTSRNRFNGPIDLHDWLTNHGALRISGGLDLLAKMIGRPGKMAVRGSDVYRLYTKGRLREINDYCLCDALDTYFVFLRTRVMACEITAAQEATITAAARARLNELVVEFPVLDRYLGAWKQAA
jgi:predicted PolB exonuclease-like 3'-5' exonuclease